MAKVIEFGDGISLRIIRGNYGALNGGFDWAIHDTTGRLQSGHTENLADARRMAEPYLTNAQLTVVAKMLDKPVPPEPKPKSMLARLRKHAKS